MTATREESFKYLSSTITNCDCSADIRVRTATALKKMSDNDYVRKNKNIRKETKMRLYNALIVPIVLNVRVRNVDSTGSWRKTTISVLDGST